MGRFLGIVTALLAAAFYGSAAGAAGIVLQSASYADFRQILAREAPGGGAVMVRGALRFPVARQERSPAVVVVHTISGYRDANEGHVAGALRKAGFATLTYDGFAARGTTGAALSRTPAYLPAGIADAFAALRALAADPRIDPGRIAILGFSFGGDVAHLAALERLRAALVPDAGRFAAHVAFYPGGGLGAAAEPGAYTGSPVLMLLAGKDDNLPVAKIESYLAYARAAGSPAPVETVIYPGAYHAWTVPTLGTPRFYKEYVSTKTCPILLLGPRAPMILVEGKEAQFDPAAFGRCLQEAPGYSMGFDAAVRARSIADAVGFLRREAR